MCICAYMCMCAYMCTCACANVRKRVIMQIRRFFQKVFKSAPKNQKVYEKSMRKRMAPTPGPHADLQMFF